MLYYLKFDYLYSIHISIKSIQFNDTFFMQNFNFSNLKTFNSMICFMETNKMIVESNLFIQCDSFELYI
jgi:hypothetical protein